MKEIVEKILGRKVENVVKLHGDASYRTYFRATLGSGETFVIMQMPPGRSSASEEITNFTGKHDEPPFINVDHFLASCGLPVPKIFKYNKAEKIMVIEDLGDNLMANFVAMADNAERERYYKRAIDLLVELQQKTASAEKSKCVALQRSFDATLLNWEFDHFREYLIEERGGVKMEEKDRGLFERETRKITEEILKMPYCFTHRDFQSRNLIVRNDGSLALIDFQDALMGPQVYDLVALLRDSYVELEWETVESLIRYYCKRSNACSERSRGVQVFKCSSACPEQSRGVQVPAPSKVEGFKCLPRAESRGSSVQEGFDLVTIQRKMKDAGRFVYIDRIKKNPNFLQYIPATLGYVKNASERISDDRVRILPRRMAGSELFEMLKKYVPEFR